MGGARGQAASEAVILCAVVLAGLALVGSAARVTVTGGVFQPIAQAPVDPPDDLTVEPGSPAAVALALWRLGIRETARNRGPMIDRFTSRHAEAWCADFVSWVLRAAERPFTGGLDGGWRLAAVASVVGWFRGRGLFSDRGVARPAPGDVVVFAHGHVGIVVRVTGSELVTVEGNAGDAVVRRTYRGWSRDADIVGFGRPRREWTETARRLPR